MGGASDDRARDVPVLIALHGAVANHAAWLPLEHLAFTRFHVVSFDLPGHGSRRAEKFDLDRSIAQTLRTIDAYAGRRIVLIGDSLGGYLALAAAARTDQLAGVVAGGCTYPMNDLRGALTALTDLTLRVFTAIAGESASNWALAGAMRAATGAATMAPIVEGGLAANARAATVQALIGSDVLQDVRRIRAPIAFVNGGLDVPIVWGASAFVRAARDARSVVVPWHGHGVSVTAPEAFIAASTALLAL